MSPEDLLHLACPTCRAGLTPGGDDALRCNDCGAIYATNDGFRVLYLEREVRPSDRLLRSIYDRVPPVVDLAVRGLVGALEAGPGRSSRERYLDRLALDALCPSSDGRPARVLEVGIGTGANIPLILRRRPPDVALDLWGIDLSLGLLRQCRALVGPEVRLVAADAHALPFPDHTFDRVLHVGGINGFGDPRRALAEMARVARPGTPIVVVDEQLDPAQRTHLLARAAFGLYTFYAKSPRCPSDQLPPEAKVLVEEQLNRFHYCLTFTVPGSAP